ncbi:MAG: hypothetical protein HY297_00530 [Thaumarchaeota archaeon]|nr:hypothetical protein [Nitrososphaerota archaeon]
MAHKAGVARKLLADAMLGSLARKLRALGFDTEYYRSGSDPDFLRLARRERRLALTADRSLYLKARADGMLSVLVVGDNDAARLTSVVGGALASSIRLVRGVSRCSVCNGPLVVLKRSEASAHVPPEVKRRHRLFHRCVDCGRVYWKGSHWKKLRSLERRLRQNAETVVDGRRQGRCRPRKGLPRAQSPWDFSST